MTAGSDDGVKILVNHADTACVDWEPKRKWLSVRSKSSKSKKTNDVKQMKDSLKQFLQYATDKNSRCGILAGYAGYVMPLGGSYQGMT